MKIDQVPDPTSEVIVSFSGGKDSLATLDLCVKRFKRVEAYFLYAVKGLSFQESVLTWAEQKYAITVHRFPDFELPRMYTSQNLTFYRADPEMAVGRIRVRELEDHIRRKVGISWIASGEKRVDSLERRAMISANGKWDNVRLHYYPIADWTNNQVRRYLQTNRIPLPAVYSMFRSSLSGLRGEQLDVVYRNFPEDYKKMRAVFPFLEAVRKRYELYGKTENDRNSEVHDPNDETK